MHCVCSPYETRSLQRRRYCLPSVSPWLLQPRRSSARHVTARAPSGPSTPTPCTRDFTVSLEKKHPSTPSQTGSNPSPSVAVMVMYRMSHRGVNPLEVIKVTKVTESLLKDTLVTNSTRHPKEETRATGSLEMTYKLAAPVWAWSGRWGTAISCLQMSAGSSLMKWLWWRIISTWLFMRRRSEQMGASQASLPISLCCQQTWTLCL